MPLIDKIKQLISYSHLQPYLALPAQEAEEKRKRIINDSAGKTPQSFPEPYQLTTTMAELHGLQSQLCISPINTLLLLWYFLVFQAIIFYFTQMTLILTYGNVAWQAELASISVLALAAFYLIVLMGDIYVQLNVGYITNSAIILNRQRVTYRYTHYHLYFDIIIVILLLIAYLWRTFALNYCKVVIMYKFVRMFQMDQLYLRRLSTQRVARLIYEISKQIVTVYVCSQLWGIFFFLMDNAMLNTPICQGSNSGFCWLNSSTAFSPIAQLPWYFQYFYTLYWGVNTMCQISYGDIAPNNPQQTIWALAGMCFGFMTYSYIVNNVIKAVIFANKHRDEFRTQLVTFDNYMAKLHLSKDNQFEVTNFLKQRFREQQNRNKFLQNLMQSKLPQDMKIQFVRNAYGHIAQGLDFFLNGNQMITRMLFSIIEKKYSDGEKIIVQGMPITQLLFMHKGKVKISCQKGHQHYLISQFQMPASFMTAYEFFLNRRASCSITATTNTVFYSISKDIFEDHCDRYLGFKQSYHQLQYDLLIRKKLERIFYSCYVCKERHHWGQCPKLFPNFSDVIFQKFDSDLIYGKVRVANKKHRTWRDYQQLKGLDRVVRRNKDRMLSRLQTRIFALKKRYQLSRETLDVDSAYDWPAYLKEQNLTKMKEKWNNRLQTAKRVTNLKSSLGRLTIM